MYSVFKSTEKALTIFMIHIVMTAFALSSAAVGEFFGSENPPKYEMDRLRRLANLIAGGYHKAFNVCDEYKIKAVRIADTLIPVFSDSHFFNRAKNRTVDSVAECFKNICRKIAESEEISYAIDEICAMADPIYRVVTFDEWKLLKDYQKALTCRVEPDESLPMTSKYYGKCLKTARSGYWKIALFDADENLFYYLHVWSDCIQVSTVVKDYTYRYNVDTESDLFLKIRGGHIVANKFEDIREFVAARDDSPAALEFREMKRDRR